MWVAQVEIDLLSSLCDHPHIVHFQGAEIFPRGGEVDEFHRTLGVSYNSYGPPLKVGNGSNLEDFAMHGSVVVVPAMEL